MRYLSVTEYARHTQDYSERHIKRLCQSGIIKCITETNNKGRPKYLIPITELSTDLQLKYYKDNNLPIDELNVNKNVNKVNNLPAYEQLSNQEREEINLWLKILDDWSNFCFYSSDKKDIATIKFIQGRNYPVQLSQDILYRKNRYKRDGNLVALVDFRGKKRKGISKIPDVCWDTFMWFYLDQRQHPVKKCYEYMQMAVKLERPDLLPLADYTTYSRHLKADVAEAVKIIGREGDKAFRDRCEPFIVRDYSKMQSNDYWIADNHTIDVITENKNKKLHRLHITAFTDARSGIFTSVFVTDNPSSQATINALRKGIEKYGIPKNIYVDNGREFLTMDVDGLGHRQKKSTKDRFAPPPIFERLGIKMTNALVKNGQAKTIERSFLDVKNQISRLFDTFCGGSVIERPEQLSKILKTDKVPTDADFAQLIENLINYYINESKYNGKVAKDKGKKKIQVYADNLIERKTAGQEDLNLMLMAF